MSSFNSHVNTQFTKAQSHFKKGENQAAILLCQQLLENNESFAPAYSLMSELFEQLGNYESAENFLNLAQKFDSHNVEYLVRQAQLFATRDSWGDALQKLILANTLCPDNATILMLLGDAYLNTQQYDHALLQYDKAISIQDLPQITEHLAYCHMIQGNSLKAESELIKLVKRHPDYIKAWILLGDLASEKKDWKVAENYFDKALDVNPNSHEALLGKGILNFNCGNNEAAQHYLDKAIDIAPNYYRTYFIIGDLLQKRMNFEESEKFYRRAMELNPGFLDARRKLAITLFSLRRKEECLEQIDLVLQQDPNNEHLLFLRATLTGETLESSPDIHVASLFDVYAETFDKHLVEGLGYKTPTELSDLLFLKLKEAGNTKTDFSLFDIGCGTGLIAEVLKDITRYRVGVDLSPRMIEEARKKEIYDVLAVDDAVKYLEKSTESFDIIAAGDVLVYIGNPEPLFAATAKKLTSGGYFVFSVENGDDSPPFVIRESSRFAHCSQFLDLLADKYSFTKIACKSTILRMEAGKPVQGYIIIYQN